MSNQDKMPALNVHSMALRNSDFQKKLATNNAFQMNVAREVTFALQALEANNYLASADPESVKTAVLNVALTGLTLNPVLNQAYLVPRRKGGKVVAVLDPSYQGLITKIVDSGIATKVVAQVVHAKDQFEFDEATDSMLVPHKKYYMMGEEVGGKEIGAYAGIQHTDGSWQYKFLPVHRINQIMEMSESHKAFMKDNSKGSIWVTHREEMVKKTAVKYLWKYLPKTDKLEAIGKAIEESDFAHEVTDTKETDNGTTIKVKETTDVVANGTKQVRKPVSRKDKSKAETIEAEEVKKEPVDTSEFQAVVTSNFDIEVGDARDVEESMEIIALMADKLHINLKEFDAFLSEKSKSFKSVDALVEKATADQIVMAVISFLK